jgi:teichoic acid transport system permease protein
VTKGAAEPADSASTYAALAAKHGLVRQGVRGPFWAYLRDIWRARHFIWALAITRTYSRNENTYLGQLWAILNPLLFAGVYYLVFGVVLNTKGDIKNFFAFLVIGVFVFQFCSSALTTGGSAIVSNTAMIRSLRFPRAALPISVVLTEFLTLLPAIVVMFVLVTLSGETPSFEWLLVPPIFVIITIFNVGVALFVSRLTHQSKDIKNLTPLVSRVLRYMSGVFYPISYYAPLNADFGHVLLAIVLQYQPYALALDVVRAPLLEEMPIVWGHVWAMSAWAAVAIVAGIVFFWRREGRYGVD